MTAKAAAAPARTDELAGADPAALQAWHLQARIYLRQLAGLAELLQSGEPDAELRAEAGAIEAFFSDTARQHHVDEERSVIPSLLASGDPGQVASARTMQQDQGWIETNWTALAPQLRAIAAGNHWIDPAEFVHDAEVFNELCSEHIALVETALAARPAAL